MLSFRTVGIAAWLVVVVLNSACAKSTTSPTDATTTTEPPSTTEVFVGVLPVGGSAFYSFSTVVTGTTTATLTSISGDGVSPSVMVNLGIGAPSGFGCSAGEQAVQVSGTADVGAQTSATRDPGVHCVLVSDIGNLFAPATFTITIQHPLVPGL